MRTSNSMVVLAFLACSAACNDGMGGDCEADLDCVDPYDCTTDVCGVGGVCQNRPVDGACPSGQVCMVGMGCVDSGGCTDNAGCDDGVACTNDVCGVGGVCMNMPIDSMCATSEVCDMTQGCVTDTGCESPADCDDSIACTNDTCGADRMCAHTPVNELCDMTMNEVCLVGTGCQEIIPCDDDDDCQNGDFCDGLEICNTEFGCMPASGPSMCSDGDDCTIDMCDATLPGENGQMGACRFDCDSSRSECMCPAPGATCNGTFSFPGATGNCSGLWTWNFQNVTFTNNAGVIELTGWTVNSSDSIPGMADPGPACPNVDASTGLSGSCNEEYRIQGTFVDDNTFTGTFTATFTGSVPIFLPDCSVCSMTVPLNGTRM